MNFYKKIKKRIPLILLIIISITAFYFIDISHFWEYKQQIIDKARENLVFSGFLYIIIYTICVSLSIPVATILTLLAGVLFGVFWGTAIVVIGATIGASIMFLIIRLSLNGKSLLEKYKSNNSLQKIQKDIKENEVSYLLFLRVVPIFPFTLVNIAPATIGVKLKTFFWTTLIGIIPGTTIYVYVGSSTGQINDLTDIFSGPILTGLGLLGLLAIIPIAVKKIIKKHKKGK